MKNYKLFTALFITILQLNGIWKLPIKDVSLIIKADNKNTIAAIEVSSSCNKPMSVLLKGDIEKIDDNYYISFKSDAYKINKGCVVYYYLSAGGEFINNDFHVNGSIESFEKCKDGQTGKSVDDISGIWKRL